jgi:hypothetical protein
MILINELKNGNITRDEFNTGLEALNKEAPKVDANKLGEFKPNPVASAKEIDNNLTR